MKNHTNHLLVAALMSCFILLNSFNSIAQWQQTNFPSSSPVLSLVISGSNMFAGTGGDGVLISSDNGNNWTNVSIGLTNLWISSVIVSGSNLFVGTGGGGVFISSNNGTTWAPAGLAGKNISCLYLIGTQIFAASTEDGVSVSANNGVTWTQQNSGLPTLAIGSFIVKGTNIFAGTYGNGIFLSTNNGVSWSPANTGLIISPIYSFVVSGANIYAGTDSHGVFMSTNNGALWTSVSTNLPTQALIHSMVVIGANIYAGTSWGIYLTTNNGLIWQDINEGFTPQGFYSFSMLKVNTYLFDGSTDKVWKRPISEITSIAEISDVKKEIEITSTSTEMIEFNYPVVDQHVSLSLYTILGQNIFTTELLTTSNHKIQVPNVKKGIYLLSIMDQSNRLTKKITIVR